MSPGTLYVVATPLGHLGDLTSRAVETFRTVAVVAAEDTRRTQGLLASIDAHPRLLSWHAHSGERRTAALVDILLAGDSVALVTDAGTPAISDPGAELVAAARAAGCPIVPIPGPSAVATALSVSGLGGDRYLFLGFLPRKGVERKRLLRRAIAEPWCVVFFEAANRLGELLADLEELCGPEREVVVARELTKMHEDIRQGTVRDLRQHFDSVPPRGEVTLVLSGRSGPEEPEAVVEPAVILAAVREGLAAGESRKDLVRQMVERFGLARNEAYRLVKDEAP
jgi:16S rRNA (cytidine1402-2'-O)-methyltransferase